MIRVAKGSDHKYYISGKNLHSSSTKRPERLNVPENELLLRHTL